MELLMVALVVVGGLITPGVQGQQVDIARHLHHLHEHTYPSQALREARQGAAEYISNTLEEYGMRVHQQPVSANITPDPTCARFCRTEEVKGVNIIGISGEEQEEAGSVVVVGAAYDTGGVGNPLHGMASVAVLLETARLYQAGAPRPHNATLFVAFDLSVEIYVRKAGGGGSGGGLPGAWSLVQDYLRSFVAQNASRVGGAIVLGPLLRVNHDNDSQGFDSRMRELFPLAHEEVEAGGYRGDFLAMVTKATQGEEAARLGREVAQSYREVGGRLVELSLGNKSAVYLPFALPPRQAAYFWASTYEGHHSPLPAILLTDTETNRQWPPDAASNTHLTEAQRVFLDTTVNSLVHFLVRRQAVEDWWETGMIVALLASCAVNLLLLVHLIHVYTSRRTTAKKRPKTQAQLQEMDLFHRVHGSECGARPS